MIQVLIDGADETSKVKNESIQISQSGDGLNSTCSFDFHDTGVLPTGAWRVGYSAVGGPDPISGYVVLWPANKVEVSITEGAETFFAGIIARVKADSYFEKDRKLHVECQDFNQMLEEQIIYDLEEYGATTDGDIIDDLFLKYSSGIDYATHVTPSGYVFDIIEFENMTLRRALDIIAEQTECIWYVDYSKKLHYATSEANAPGWHLSDKFDNVNSFSYYDDITKESDAANMVNSIFLVGGVVSLWFEDAASIAEYGYHRTIISDTSLIDPDDMEAYADRVLNRYSQPLVVYRLKTRKVGLRAGMNIRLVNNLYAVDASFLINSLNISWSIDEEILIFDLVLGGTASSVSASASRLNLDAIRDGQDPIGSTQLPLASRGWGHDMTFSATDHNTVAWTAGTITTAGGDTFSIAAGNTDDPGAMAAKIIVYLDTVISLTDLQMTTDETAALGNNRIMVAVAWPSGVPFTDAGFQVFGASVELATYLNATNIIADCITANEIYGNTLSVIAADMGALTAGTVTLTGGAGTGTVVLSTGGIGIWDAAANLRIRLNANDGTFELTSAEPGNARIEIDNTEIVGYDAANVKQFYLSAADGKAYAGAGAVRMDKGGLYLVELGALDTGYLHFEDGGSDRAIIHGYDDATGNHLVLYAVKPALAADQGTIFLEAKDSTGAAGAKVQLNSKMTGTVGSVVIATEGAMDFAVYPSYTKVFDDLRIGGGIVIGNTTVNPAQGLIYCDGPNTNATTSYELGHHTAAADVASNGYLNIWINGTLRKVMTRA